MTAQPRPPAVRGAEATPFREDPHERHRRAACRRASRVHRAELFDNLAQVVKRETDNLARLMAQECGKVITECRAEVVEGLHMIQYVFGTGRMPTGQVVASEIWFA